MIEKPHIVQTEERPAAVIRLTIPREEIQKVMEPGIRELVGTVSKQGIGPAGPLFSHHLRVDPEIFDFEIGVPVSEPVSETGRVERGRLPAAKVVRTVYRGPYEGLPSAWGEFDSWITEAGLATAPNLWERYVSGPESDPDPATWRTELNRPLTE